MHHGKRTYSGHCEGYSTRATATGDGDYRSRKRHHREGTYPQENRRRCAPRRYPGGTPRQLPSDEGTNAMTSPYLLKPVRSIEQAIADIERSTDPASHLDDETIHLLNQAAARPEVLYKCFDPSTGRSYLREVTP